MFKSKDLVDSLLFLALEFLEVGGYKLLSEIADGQEPKLANKQKLTKINILSA